MAKYPELTITISLEGSELLHDRFRGRGSYWKAVKGLKNALEAELDVVIFTLASKSVLPVLPKYADKLFYWFPGIKYLSLNRLVKPAYGNTFLEKEFLRPVDYLGLVRTVSLLNLIDRPTVLLNDPLINVVSRIVNIPWTPESKPLQCYGNLMIMADLSFNLAHTSNTFLGRYRPGSINRIRSSDRYQQAVSKNQQVCHTCRYVDLCQDRGLIRPVDVPTTGQEDSHFCKAVLNLVST